MSRIFTSGLLFCIEAAFEHIHTLIQEYCPLEEVQTGGSIAEDGGGTGGGGAAVGASSGSIGGSVQEG